MTPDLQLIEDLVKCLPAFEDLYESHVSNEDAPAWRATVAFLDEQFGTAEPKAREVVVTSFLDSLPFPGQPGSDLTRYLGPQLTSKLAELRPSLTF